MVEAIRKGLNQARTGLTVFRDPKRATYATAAQLFAWFLQLLACWALFAALGLDHQVSIGAAAAVLFAVNVTAVVPATPSNIGIFQLAVISVLNKGFGVSAADALAYGVILQAVEIATAVALGVPALVREGVTWSDMRLRALSAAPVRLSERPRAREREQRIPVNSAEAGARQRIQAAGEEREPDGVGDHRDHCRDDEEALEGVQGVLGSAALVDAAVPGGAAHARLLLAEQPHARPGCEHQQQPAADEDAGADEDDHRAADRTAVQVRCKQDPRCGNREADQQRTEQRQHPRAGSDQGSAELRPPPGPYPLCADFIPGAGFFLDRAVARVVLGRQLAAALGAGDQLVGRLRPRG